ncbi:major facilitator superfamily transporter [Neofusicoccum parvum]|nr:major facilitator superfamily transporter [Neofusicoccum parvum]
MTSNKANSDSSSSKDLSPDKEKEHIAAALASDTTSRSPSPETVPSETADEKNALSAIPSPALKDNGSKFLEGAPEKDVEADAKDGEGSRGDNAGPETPQARRVAIGVALALTMFVVALDSTIISTIIPHLVEPVFGKAYPFFNTKYGFLTGMFFFEVGSLICALATSSGMFIAGRTVAGTAGALMAPGVMLIIADVIPKEKRPLFTGLIASAAGIAACLGPVIGGILASRSTWRWCFYMNLPIGGATVFAMTFLYKPRPRTTKGLPLLEKIKSLDLPGSALMASSVTCLLLAFTFAGEGAWSEPKVIGLLVAFAVLLGGLVFEQFLVPEDRALIPRSIMKKRGIIICSIFGFLTEVGSSSQVYFLPFYFQGVKGSTAEGSGVDLLAYLISQTVGGILTGVAINRFKVFNPSMLFGSVAFSIGAGLLHTLSIGTPSSQWIGYQILAAFGTGCCQFIAMGVAQQELDRHEEAIGLAVVYMIKMLGSSVAVSLCSTLFYKKLQDSLHSSGLSQSIIDGILHSLVLKGSGTTDPAVRLAVAEAVAKGVQTAFIVPIASGVLSFCVAVLHKWKKIGDGKAAS